MLLRTALILSAGLGALSASAQTSLNGRIEQGRYVSPTGTFSIPIPVLPELGGTVTDTANVVTFEDRFNMHLSIAVFAMNAAQQRELAARGTKEYLIHFFQNFVLPDFQNRFSGTRVEKAVFLPGVQNGALLAHTLLPGGSMFAKRGLVPRGSSLTPGAASDLPQPVAKRGNLLFVQSGSVFVVSTELAERVLEQATYNKTPDQEDEILRQRLLDYVSKMSFTEPAARKAP